MRAARTCLVLAAGLLAAAAQAAPCGPFNVSMYEHGALYYRSGEQWAGIDKDIVEELARRTGCQLNMTRESRVRIWTMLQEGTLDITMSGIATPERELYGRFTPYLQTRNLVLVRQEVAPRAASMAQFLAQPDLKVGVIKSFRHGASYDAWLDKLRGQGRVYESADYATLLRVFQHGRVHAILQLTSNVDTLLHDETMRGLFRAMDWVPKENVLASMVIARRLPAEAADRLEQALRAMREDGTMRTILERHVPSEDTAGMLLR